MGDKGGSRTGGDGEGLAQPRGLTGRLREAPLPASPEPVDARGWRMDEEGGGRAALVTGLCPSGGRAAHGRPAGPPSPQ